VKLSRKQSNPIEEYYRDTRERFHGPIAWALGVNVLFNSRYYGRDYPHIIPGEDSRNPIDPAILRDTAYMDEWIEDIRSEVEQSLRGHGFSLDTVTLHVDWPDTHAPKRATFYLQVHRTAPEVKQPWYKRIIPAVT
jgi:hypothetical protein